MAAYARVGRPLTPGSREDFALLYETTYPGLVRAITRALGNAADAEECVQQAFVRGWSAWPRWRPESDPEAWIARIAVRVAINRTMYERLRRLPEIVRRFGAPVPARDPAQSVERFELLGALAALTLRDRLIVIWYYDHGLPIAQIAARVGTSRRTVELRLSNSRRRLRELLGSTPPGYRAAARVSAPLAGIDDGS